MAGRSPRSSPSDIALFNSAHQRAAALADPGKPSSGLRKTSRPPLPMYVFGNMTRVDAEDLLVGAGGHPGLFLVREKYPDTAYVLSCVNPEGNMDHHMIVRSELGDGTLAEHFEVSDYPVPSCTSIEDVINWLLKPHNDVPGLPVIKTPLDCRSIEKGEN